MKLHSTYVSGFFSSCKIPKSTYVKKIFFKSAHIKCTYDDGAFITLHLLYIDSNQVERERWKDIKLQKFSCFLIMTQLFSRRRAFLIFRTRRSKTAASSISSPPIKRTSGLRWPFNSCQVSKYLPQDRYFSDTQCSILLILASLVIYGAIMVYNLVMDRAIWLFRKLISSRKSPIPESWFKVHHYLTYKKTIQIFIQCSLSGKFAKIAQCVIITVRACVLY